MVSKIFILMLSLVVQIPSSFAHIFDPIVIAIEELRNATYLVTIKGASSKKGGATLIPPETCKLMEGDTGVKAPHIEQKNMLWLINFAWECKNPLQGGQALRISNSRFLGDLVVRFKSIDEPWASQAYTAGSDDVFIPQAKGKHSGLKSYFSLGFEHILEGWDHLLFILALCLLAFGLKTLTLVISSFTVGHTISLFLSAGGVWVVPSLFVEIMIALSIVLLARDVLQQNKKTSLIQSHPYLIAIIFGLIHGLGFANNLINIGISQDNLVSSIFGFNLGVEFGQLLFMAVAIGLINNPLAHQLTDKIPKLRMIFRRESLAVLIGLIGSFWFFERITGVL